jgi:hypothetical protein
MRSIMFGVLAAVLLVATAHAAQTPSVDIFKQALEKRLLQLKPDGMTER